MGPWKVIWTTSRMTEEPLVQVIDETGEVICDNEIYYPKELDPKYAPLIAAAPELLEECKAWLSSYDGWSDVELAKRVDIATLDRIKYTREVVRKATGEVR